MQRRVRFTVNFEDGREPEVILAYNAAQVQVHYAKKGLTVRVRQGDFRKAAIVAQKKREGGFRLDSAAIRDACEQLGIKLAVRIRFNGRVGGMNGNHCFPGGYHNIMLKSYLTPEQATKTLWHELVHALQAERDGEARPVVWAEFVGRQQRRYTYRNRPIEIEARQMAEMMADCPLTKPL